MKKIFSFATNTHTSGFVLLFAVVISAIIFFVGAGIFSISFKELIISSTAKESQKSIFAADAGIECALYADRPGGGSPFAGSGTTTQVTCFGKPVEIIPDGAGKYRMNMLFDENNSCAVVTVERIVDAGGNSSLKFFSQGYNKCREDGSPVTTYPGLTERVYTVTFGS